MRRQCGTLLAALAAGLVAVAEAAQAGELLDPPVLSSRHGMLDLLVVARAAPAPVLSGQATMAWVYDICGRPVDGAQDCPHGGGAPDAYGGTRLQLDAGDRLRIRLINRLPPNTNPVDPDDAATAYLALNPVNIFADGMLLSPRFPTVGDPTYGDTDSVMTLNPANGPLPPDANIASDVRVGHADYIIKIPEGHPPGLFWFHPQIHGLALSQVAAGMAGIITVGALSDYVCAASPCESVLGTPRVRHIILKDSQVLADGRLLGAQDPEFCDPATALDDTRPLGGCPGVSRLRPDGGADYSGGRWVFTLNGQTYPSITVVSGGEIWRIANASGAAVYDLGVHLTSEHRDLVVQVLASDGVAVSLPAGLTPGETASLGGGKFATANCPADVSARTGPPLCVSRILVRPGSRVEFWVAYRDPSGRLAPPPAGTQAVLETLGLQIGRTDRPTPSVALARVDFSGSSGTPSTPQFLTVARGAKAHGDLERLSRNLDLDNERFLPEPDCRPLALGHHRRVFLNNLAARGNPHDLGLGYEEVDAAGHTVPGTFRDIEPFSPNRTSICVPLSPGNRPVHEPWELVNLGPEDDGFHVQQARAMVIGSSPGRRWDAHPHAITQDRIFLPHASASCETVDNWRAGICLAYPVMVDMAFAVAGDFVYLSDDLGHDDNGMMAPIRVRAAR